MSLKHRVSRLRVQRAVLMRIRDEKDLAAWRRETRPLALAALEGHDALTAAHGQLWGDDHPEPASRADYLASLNAIIRGLNRTDELRLFQSPTVILTIGGILFLALLAGGGYFYYTLFIKPGG